MIHLAIEKYVTKNYLWVLIIVLHLLPQIHKIQNFQRTLGLIIASCFSLTTPLMVIFSYNSYCHSWQKFNFYKCQSANNVNNLNYLLSMEESSHISLFSHKLNDVDNMRIIKSNVVDWGKIIHWGVWWNACLKG